jgi:3-hydroxyacyl-CoA dehydrogenase/enoyl-CoA hydratase/3-hydroxybutyryl-CoA epimerase
MTDAPALTQFHLDFPGNGLVHLIFDCPGRSMNVFSEAAIEDLARFVAWLPEADVTGVLIRSGKDNAFCAGADLGELGVAYDMIVAAPERARFGIAFDHFFRLGAAMRALEVVGKPVAIAIAGLALGGGCELALAAHHRVLVDDPKVAMGLPESLVGLLPGAGGTQRLPRLVGAEGSLPILLDGARLSGRAALEAGLVDALATPGEEITAAEAWLLSSPDASQPWDRDDWVPESAAAIGAVIAPVRARVLAETLGHYPAPLAILDCVEFGLPQVFDGAIRTEMAIFSHLIQRREARDMIQVLFLGKTDYERAVRKQAVPVVVADAIAALTPLIKNKSGMLQKAGFGAATGKMPARHRTGRGYWVDSKDAGEEREAIDTILAQARHLAPGLSSEERRMADYALVVGAGFPAYLGGPFAQIC